MKKKLVLFITILLLTPVTTAFGELPEIKKNCAICHGSHGTEKGMQLSQPLPGLCIQCHPDRTGEGEHVIGVKPSRSDIGSLPLDGDGSITCTTCHDPHGKDGYPSMLRAPGEELCNGCHIK